MDLEYSDNFVSVKAIKKIGEDERGQTSVFSLPRKQDQFVFIERHPNTMSGNTYHEGQNEGTSPKVFVFLQGKFNVIFESCFS